VRYDGARAHRPFPLACIKSSEFSHFIPPLTTVCGTRHPQTDAPTEAPTKAPSNSPEKAPSIAPSTKAPAAPCTGGTSYWLYDPTTNVPIRRLGSGTAVCLAHPYNIEVRPCNGTSTFLAGPVRIQLARTRRGGPVVHRSKPQAASPYFLFGPASANGDVLASPKALPNGQYYLSAQGAAAWGRLKLTQDCSCAKGKKGMKRCTKG
jgi:hypothetical protein